jgi:hypothetical protein
LKCGRNLGTASRQAGAHAFVLILPRLERDGFGMAGTQMLNTISPFD